MTSGTLSRLPRNRSGKAAARMIATSTTSPPPCIPSDPRSVHFERRIPEARRATLRPPAGTQVKEVSMILCALLVAALVLPPAVFERGPATPAPEPERSARAAFEKFKALEGRWVGESTRGWKEEVSFKT